jgi:hypothetical protein
VRRAAPWETGCFPVSPKVPKPAYIAFLWSVRNTIATTQPGLSISDRLRAAL